MIYRYGILLAEAKKMPAKDGTVKIMQTLKTPPETWQVGHTKVFMKGTVEVILENLRAEKIIVFVIRLQRFGKCILAKKKLRILKESLVIIQKVIRGWLTRMMVIRARKALLRIQAMCRGRRARKVYKVMLAEYRAEQKKKKEEELVRRKQAEAEARAAGAPDDVLDEFDDFEGLSAEEKMRQKELLKYLESTQAEREKNATLRMKRMAPVLEEGIFLPEELEKTMYLSQIKVHSPLTVTDYIPMSQEMVLGR